MTNLEGFGSDPGRWRQPVGLGAQDRNIGRRIAADQARADRSAIGQADADVFIFLDDVVGRDDDSVSRPDDAAGGQPAAGFHAHDARTGGLDRSSKGVGQVCENFGHGFVSSVGSNRLHTDVAINICTSLQINAAIRIHDADRLHGMSRSLPGIPAEHITHLDGSEPGRKVRWVGRKRVIRGVGIRRVGLQKDQPQPRGADNGFSPRCDAEFAKDGVDVKLHGVFTDPQFHCNGLVGQPLSDEAEDGQLAGLIPRSADRFVDHPRTSRLADRRDGSGPRRRRRQLLPSPASGHAGQRRPGQDRHLAAGSPAHRWTRLRQRDPRPAGEQRPAGCFQPIP